VRLADLPPQPVDTVVRVAITHVDLLAATLDCRFINTLPP
jgi:hypothetical protein